MRQRLPLFAKPKRLGGLRSIGLTIALSVVGLPMLGAYAEGYSFSGVTVTGNARIEDQTVQSYAKIPVGERLNDGDLNEAYQNILSSGLFETVEFNVKGDQLEIGVVEYPTINRINFEGNARISDDVLTRVIQSQSRRVFNPIKAVADADTIAEAYAQQGRLAARIAPKIIKQANNRVDLVFEVFEGGVVEVERIGFVGNKTFSDSRLRRVLATKQAGLISSFISSDSYVEDRIAVDRQRIEDFYRARGFVDARVTSAGAQLTQDRGAHFLTFTIVEGRQFTIGTLDVKSEIPGVDAAPFLDAIAGKSGKAFDPAIIDRDVTRLELKALRLGQDFVKVTPRFDRNVKAQTINVTYDLTPAPKVFVERINITGNTATLDRVIRQQIKMVEGDPFNPRALREAEDRLRALNIFQDVEASVRDGSKSGQVMIDMKITEKPTGSLSLGGTYSSSLGVGAIIRYNELNFLGRGQELSLAVSNASTAQVYGMKFIEPALLGRDVRLTLDFAFERTDNQTGSYDTEIARALPELRFPLSESIGFTTRAGLQAERIFNPSNLFSSVINIDVGKGRVTRALIGYGLDYDSRRTGIDPNTGFTLKFNQDLAGLSSDTLFLKTGVVATAQRKLFNDQLVLRSTFEGGVLSFQKGKSLVTDRYFLSTDQMRGFDLGGIGPREIGPLVNESIGGNKFAVMRFEAQFPLGLPEEYGISGGLFYDLGSVWDSGTSLPGCTSSTPTVNCITSNDFRLRQSIGASLFWTTPIGPLRFNFSKALAKEEFDVEREFEVTISAQF